MEIDDLINSISFSESENLPDALAGRLSELIIQNKLPDGYYLPRETILCEKLGVSRNTLREAYKTLESRGYITRSRRGTRINPHSTVLQSMPFSAAIQLSENNDIIEFRTIFESENARLAAMRANSKNIAKLEYALNMMIAWRDDLATLSKYDMSFHVELARATQNSLLIKTMEMASETFLKSIEESFRFDTENNIEQAIMCHREILEAILTQDSKLARNVMRRHISNIRHLTQQ